jgi:hypothetical protein
VGLISLYVFFRVSKILFYGDDDDVVKITFTQSSQFTKKKMKNLNLTPVNENEALSLKKLNGSHKEKHNR